MERSTIGERNNQMSVSRQRDQVVSHNKTEIPPTSNKVVQPVIGDMIYSSSHLRYRKKQRHLLQYVKELTSQSTFPGAPQIIQVSNHCRKLIKILVLILCAIGLGIQIYMFMEAYYTYPVSVELGMKYKRTLPVPKLTFCNRNGFQRKPFCRSNPKYCHNPPNVTDFCSKYGDYCKTFDKDENITVVITDVLSLNYHLLRNYSQKPTELFADFCYSYISVRNEILNETTAITYRSEGGQYRTCYSVDYSKIKSRNLSNGNINIENNLPCVIWTGQGYNQFIITTILNIQSNQYSRPEIIPGIQVGVSDPHIEKHPFLHGFRVLPGKKYIVKMKAIEQSLAVQRFLKTCKTDEDLKAGYNREVCINECIVKLSVKQCQCTLGTLARKNMFKYCNRFDNLICLRNIDASTCYLTCQEHCNTISFQYKVEEMENANTLVPFNGNLTSGNLSEIPEFFKQIAHLSANYTGKDQAVVVVTYETDEITILKYKAMFDEKQILGIIGGYSGIWLGVSLVTLFNVAEDLILIVHFILYGK